MNANVLICQMHTETDSAIGQEGVCCIAPRRLLGGMAVFRPSLLARSLCVPGDFVKHNLVPFQKMVTRKGYTVCHMENIGRWWCGRWFRSCRRSGCWFLTVQRHQNFCCQSPRTEDCQMFPSSSHSLASIHWFTSLQKAVKACGPDLGAFRVLRCGRDENMSKVIWTTRVV